MIEVEPGLFVGNQRDEEAIRQEDNWRVVHACKEPYHREALGYSGRAAPKDHPEYLLAYRENRLICNLVDVDDPKYIAACIIDAALSFIAEGRSAGDRVLVHCNQGASRSPTIAMLHMQSRLPADFETAEESFRLIYPPYSPARGMREFARARWIGA